MVNVCFTLFIYLCQTMDKLGDKILYLLLFFYSMKYLHFQINNIFKINISLNFFQQLLTNLQLHFSLNIKTFSVIQIN